MQHFNQKPGVLVETVERVSTYRTGAGKLNQRSRGCATNRAWGRRANAHYMCHCTCPLSHKRKSACPPTQFASGRSLGSCPSVDASPLTDPENAAVSRFYVNAHTHCSSRVPYNRNQNEVLYSTLCSSLHASLAPSLAPRSDLASLSALSLSALSAHDRSDASATGSLQVTRRCMRA